MESENQNTASADESTVDSRLDKIEGTLARLAQRLDKPDALDVRKKEDTKVEEKVAAEHGNPNSSSKLVLAGLFAVVGLKLGGLIGGKIGAIFDLKSLLGESKAIEKTIKAADDFGDMQSSMKEMMKYMRFTMVGAAIGSIAGTLGGAVLGWNRGDRIKNPGDLLKHPVESIKVIFAKDSPKPDVDTKKEAVSNIEGVKLHQGTVVNAHKELAV